MSKRKILLAALAICLVAILSMGSLAWFNSTDQVTNTFKFDDTDNDGTPDFKVEVFETGEGVNGGKEYLHIAPNAVLEKDPTVKNTGDYDMYARLVVTLSDADAWMDAAEKYALTAAGKEETVLEAMVTIHSNWVRFDDPVYNSAADTITYVYYYADIIDTDVADVTEPLFETVTIPYQLQAEDMTFGDDTFTINVKADAVQSDNIPVDTISGSENDAYKAFDFVEWDAGVEYPEPQQRV